MHAAYTIVPVPPGQFTSIQNPIQAQNIITVNLASGACQISKSKYFSANVRIL